MWNASCDKHGQCTLWSESGYIRAHYTASQLSQWSEEASLVDWSLKDEVVVVEVVGVVRRKCWECSRQSERSLPGSMEGESMKLSRQVSTSAWGILALGEVPSWVHCGQEFPAQTCLGSVSQTASLCRHKTCCGAIVLAPARNSEEAVWGQVWWRLRLWTQPGGLEKPCLSALGGSRKPFIALPFSARFESRLRAVVFTGPIWRQVFQIKLSSLLSLKDACSLREGRLPAPMLVSCCGDKSLNKCLFIWLDRPSVCVWFPAETSSLSPKVSFLKG